MTDSDTSVPVLRLPHREVWLDVPGYEGFKVKMWANYPQRLLDDLTGADVPAMEAALLRVVLEHNGWGNEEGEPFPPANEAAFWDAIPTELAAILLVLATQEVVSHYPNSLFAKRRR